MAHSRNSREESEKAQACARPLISEFPNEGLVAPISRRGLLKAAGFSFAGAVITGCSRAPNSKALPYLVQPEAIVPGRPVFYASTCGACPAACGVLVKNRDGRPIKLEGNPDHLISRGGLCAVGQASLLGLYDSHRFRTPLQMARETDWATVDAGIMQQLALIKQHGDSVRLLSGTINSPTIRAVIQEFLAQFQDAQHITYDALSCAAILDAHQRTHGARVLPHYKFDSADVVVSFDADFLGTWISPVEFTAGYTAARNLQGSPARCSYHVQFESRLSLTGSKADRRFTVSPRDIGPLLTALTVRVREFSGRPWLAAESPPRLPLTSEQLDELAARLWNARGRSLVVCGENRLIPQVACNHLNELLNNYGSTLDVTRPSLQRQGDDQSLLELKKELWRGSVAALFVYGANPVYELPDGAEAAKAIRRVPLSVSFAERLDETAAVVKFVCPDHHFLESWGDAEPVSGRISLIQPMLAPLADTRSMIESLSRWMGKGTSAYELVRQHWRERIFPAAASEGISFEQFWDRTLRDGHVEVQRQPIPVRRLEVTIDDVGSASRPATQGREVSPESFSLILYPKLGMLDGRHAYNPWLQELPDPITKAVWDNYACLSPRAAERLAVRDGDVVEIRVAAGGGEPAPLELPVLVQPGQYDFSVAVALGYGSELTRRFADLGPRWLQGRPTVGPNGLVGRNAAGFIGEENGCWQYAGRRVMLRKTGKCQTVATTQAPECIGALERLAAPDAIRRGIIRETTLSDLLNAQTRSVGPTVGHMPVDEPAADLWPADHPYPRQHWGMVVDLARCTGCSACVIACQAENNIPSVGKDEVRRKREMHWIRIDRYYSELTPEAAAAPVNFIGPAAAAKMQCALPSDVDVAYQPMMCQHCGNAACETVCPALATVHSEDGLNEQVYNRCVGTRYCANNCPYKLRRFNWFAYHHGDSRQKLVLNPDVTVRSRGVMEKCSMCAQRIQVARLEAKRQTRLLSDGEIHTACQQSCPAGAITFGDLNDPNSAVSRLVRSERYYRVLEELNARPSVGYLAVVRNRSCEAKRS